MRREGRQHGMVRTYAISSAPYNPRVKPRYPNELNSQPTAGLFTKVSSKPTNHSKFTDKCARPKCRDCHMGSPCKARDKVKGTHKTRSSGVGLITRVVGQSGGIKISGFSATRVLGYLDGDDGDVGSFDYRDRDDDYDDEICDCIFSSRGVEIDDDKMSFCEVGLDWESLDEDEDWCLVEE